MMDECISSSGHSKTRDQHSQWQICSMQQPSWSSFCNRVQLPVWIALVRCTDVVITQSFEKKVLPARKTKAEDQQKLVKNFTFKSEDDGSMKPNRLSHLHDILRLPRPWNKAGISYLHPCPLLFFGLGHVRGRDSGSCRCSGGAEALAAASICHGLGGSCGTAAAGGALNKSWTFWLFWLFRLFALFRLFLEVFDSFWDPWIFWWTKQHILGCLLTQ